MYTYVALIFTVLLLSSCERGKIKITLGNFVNSLTTTATPVNTVPTLTVNTTLITSEGAGTLTGVDAGSITTTEILISDDQESDSDILITLESVPSNGNIYNNNTTSTLGVSDTFTMQDIVDGYIEFHHTGASIDDSNGNIADSFDFSYEDGKNAAVTGNTFNITVNTLCSDKSTATSHTAYGQGTAAFPHLICTAAQLNSLGASTGADLTKNYLQRAQIDMSSIAGNHNIIGDNSDASANTRFLGTYDGNKNKILNWTHIDNTKEFVGIFGLVYGDNVFDGLTDGVLKNIYVEKVNIDGYKYVGGLAAYIGNYAKVSYCYTKGNIKATGPGGSGDGGVGGLVGAVGSALSVNIAHGTVEYSYSMVNIDGDHVMGGLVGQMYGSQSYILNSHAHGNINSTGQRVGGLVGFARWGYIRDSYATGSVTSTSTYTGGCVGHQGSVTASNTYCTGNVTGNSSVGGFVGFKDQNNWQSYDNYATGNVSGVNNVGGFVGNNRGVLKRSYSLGSVTGSGVNVGGFVGRFQNINTPHLNIYIEDSYALGNVYGNDSVGGFVGTTISFTATRWTPIRDSYSAGRVSAAGTNVNGFVGFLNGETGPIQNSFFDSTTAGVADSASGVTGLTTAAMQTKANFTGASWDWVGTGSETWVMPQNDTDSIGYPKLTFFYPCYGSAFTGSPTYEGAGTILDPYKICTAAQMAQIKSNSSDFDKYFRLYETIDVSAHDMRFVIGSTGSNPFKGTFDGNMRNGLSIDNIFYNGSPEFGIAYSSDSDNFFDGVNDGHFYNVHLKDVDITSSGQNVGTFLARPAGIFLISHSYVSGSVSASGIVGGFIGRVQGGTGEIYRSGANVDVTATSISRARAGGLIGWANYNTLSEVYSMGTVTSGSSLVGGLIGQGNNTNIDNSYSFSDVSGLDSVGGVIGAFGGTTAYRFSTSYSSGLITGGGGTDVGGFSGRNAAILNIDSFCNVDLSTQASCKTASDLSDANSKLAANYTNWDMNTVWTTFSDDTYPRLLWQKWTECSAESGSCSDIPSGSYMKYGRDGVYNYYTTVGADAETINCTDAKFGDPGNTGTNYCYYLK